MGSPPPVQMLPQEPNAQPFQRTSNTPTAAVGQQQHFAVQQDLQQRLLDARNQATQRIETARQQYANAEAARQRDLAAYASQVEDAMAQQQQQLARTRALAQSPNLLVGGSLPPPLPPAGDQRGMPAQYFARGGLQHMAPGGGFVGGPASPAVQGNLPPNTFTWGQMTVRQYTSPRGEPRHQILDAAGAVQGDYADSDPSSPVIQNPSGSATSRFQQNAQRWATGAPSADAPQPPAPPPAAAPAPTPTTGPVMSNVPGMSQENLDALNAKTQAVLAAQAQAGAQNPPAPFQRDPAYQAALDARAAGPMTLAERQQRQFDEARGGNEGLSWGRFARGGPQLPLAPGAAPPEPLDPGMTDEGGQDTGTDDPNAIVGEGQQGPGGYKPEMVLSAGAFHDVDPATGKPYATIATSPKAVQLGQGSFVIPLAPHLQQDAISLAQEQPGEPVTPAPGRQFQTPDGKLMARGGAAPVPKGRFAVQAHTRGMPRPRLPLAPVPAKRGR